MSTTSADQSDRLYLLRPNVHHALYCGRTADGKRFLLGPKDDSTACVVSFDREGNYLGWQERFVGHGALFPLPPPGASASHEQWIIEVGRHYERLISEIGGRLELIHVHAFTVPDAQYDMSISEFPWYLQRLRDDPDREKQELGDTEFERFARLLAEWVERGDYVLTWGGDHHVNKDGEIVFS